MTEWTMDRRAFLKAAGVLGAGVAMKPGFAWSAAGDTLRIRMEGDLQCLDPAFMNGGIEDVMMRGIYVSLNHFGDIRKGSPWSLWGAEKLEQKDPKTIAFTLIDGLKWSGGFGAVTADDVKFSFERIADKALASPWAYQFEKLDRVEVVDARSGIIHLKEPYQPIFVTSLPYYGGHIISRAGTEKAGGKFTTQPPATCGPYLFSDWQQKQKVTLTANPDWPGPKPDFSKVEIYVVSDDQAAQLAYEADAFDYTKIAISATKAVKASPPADTTLIEAQSTRYVWLTINMLSPRLKDLKVRQAVQYGVDVGQVLTGVYDDLTKRSTGVVQPGTKFARAGNLIAAVDYEKSAALLKEAGVSDLSLTLTVMNDSIRTATAQIIQASLEQAGIKVEIQPYDEAAFWGVGDKTQGDGYKNIDLALMDFAGGIDPSENLVWFRPDQIGAYNWSGFDSAEFETSYQQLVAESDEAKRIALSNRMEDLMEQSGGFVFICGESLVAIHKTTPPAGFIRTVTPIRCCSRRRRKTRVHGQEGHNRLAGVHDGSPTRRCKKEARREEGPAALQPRTGGCAPLHADRGGDAVPVGRRHRRFHHRSHLQGGRRLARPHQPPFRKPRRVAGRGLQILALCQRQQPDRRSQAPSRRDFRLVAASSTCRPGALQLFTRIFQPREPADLAVAVGRDRRQPTPQGGAPRTLRCLPGGTGGGHCGCRHTARQASRRACAGAQFHRSGRRVVARMVP